MLHDPLVPLSDSFGRTVTYLRVSVTDRCDLRCTYCMSEHTSFMPKRELLTLEELDRLVSAFVDLGVRKLRVTGGEPLVRRGIMTFFQAMGRHVRSGALKELTLTTNGTLLARHAAELADCGVKRVNVSLDTLDPAKYGRITRWGRLENVLGGIAAAQAAGLRVKINTVALRGQNDDELFRLVDWCAEQGCDLTFIEVMPMGEFGVEDRLSQFWPLSELRAELETRYRLADTALSTGGPASYVRVAETGQTIGFIRPLSHNFCATCNRVRLSCRGELYTCLGTEGSSDLRPALRDGEAGLGLYAAIQTALRLKPAGHAFGYLAGGVQGAMARGMNHTGG
ncbi:GTP 3',8-cyclase MoaA [Rhodobacter sphaeroides]|jgi:cyclic pyranopterin phosphate synthase|uniref:GTP 3',8-cyclase n=2 Tax=Cereibacter sphaeroides TaxID=1063 RepID=Q3IXR8_CERS4|nr:GTP 3',8-cyclase MoaA [Cereibacter sphaeroides]ABN78857.1 GTP cyclohydrolase subunit MoaA [Cereibacter sphaeroides ATCC 17029]ABA80666.1 cyclic pyranopterin monophosphate synthase subunit MoaA [Cereibacter sphaeroides 2.4.1]ACM03081.1 GTP cyclohydrolase subunit MoaA [Cereibacter sphaeroides KD131]AMJ48993.1 cyclic pyranopterin phosphate synthase MoaA [Cereibacter sphaeroides]ANS35709.1 cyclic pyranopterin phosphate synthase [Cereibacter sphaeroides]